MGKQAPAMILGVGVARAGERSVWGGSCAAFKRTAERQVRSHKVRLGNTCGTMGGRRARSIATCECQPSVTQA